VHKIVRFGKYSELIIDKNGRILARRYIDQDMTEEYLIALVEALGKQPVEPLLFRITALLLPRRLWEEELGDALEVLHALRAAGAPRWQLNLKIFSTLTWSLVNALREVMSAVTGQARGREK
jgi:hypothetical protein